MQIPKETILAMILTGLSGKPAGSKEELEVELDGFLSGPFSQALVHRSWLLGELLTRITTKVEACSVISDNNSALDWFSSQDKEGWLRWQWLRLYMAEANKRPGPIIAEIDRSTDTLMRHLRDPSQSELFDRRGLVVGHVQSGKTQHYTALIAKAIDAGYKVIIVLAGIHENLRVQTQTRIEEAIIGRNVASNTPDAPIGIAEFRRDRKAIEKSPATPNNSYAATTRLRDFNSKTVRSVELPLGEQPYVLVIKKNIYALKAVLRRLRGGRRPYTTYPYPVLVIDDEADHSSINTKILTSNEATAINSTIREILWCCDKVSYVGYTATPYANIFMSDYWPPENKPRDRSLVREEGGRRELGGDLFPRHFVMSLKAPENYLGAAEVFGREADTEAELGEITPLPMHLPVRDVEEWLPANHKSGFEPGGDIPASLSKALKLYVLGCAARIALGDLDANCAMLVHVTRFTNVQGRVARQIRAKVMQLNAELFTDANRDDAWRKLEDMWNDEYFGNFHTFKRHYALQLIPPRLPDWQSVVSAVKIALEGIEVDEINAKNPRVYEDKEHEKARYIIAVGGNSLSRGLTLDGLITSYFWRGARAYDTLMQMGRWFGYRPGYTHFCRIFSPPETAEAFREIILATDELRKEFDLLASQDGLTPIEYGLKVREPRADLLVTAYNKMRAGATIKVHFGRSLISSLMIAEADLAQNFLTFKDLWERLASLSPPHKRQSGGSFLAWDNIPHNEVLDFLKGYNAANHPSLNLSLGGSGIQATLVNYIERLSSYGHLVSWTIGVATKQDEVEGIWPDGPRPVIRARLFDKDGQPQRRGWVHFKGVAVGRSEALDLPHLVEQESISSAKCRHERTPENGLLLLYPIRCTKGGEAFKFDAAITDAFFQETGVAEVITIGVAVSLPSSQHDTGLEYVCNPVMLRNLFGENYASDEERDLDEVTQSTEFLADKKQNHEDDE